MNKNKTLGAKNQTFVAPSLPPPLKNMRNKNLGCKNKGEIELPVY